MSGELSLARWAVAGSEGVEDQACFPRGTSHPLPFVCPHFPLHRLPFASPTGVRFWLQDRGSLSTEPPDPGAHGWPGGPHFLPPLLLSNRSSAGASLKLKG